MARRTHGTARLAGWAALLDGDQRGASDDGNPCQGIVIGCLLSLPIWLGFAAIVLSLIG